MNPNLTIIELWEGLVRSCSDTDIDPYHHNYGFQQRIQGKDTHPLPLILGKKKNKRRGKNSRQVMKHTQKNGPPSPLSSQSGSHLLLVFVTYFEVIFNLRSFFVLRLLISLIYQEFVLLPFSKQNYVCVYFKVLIVFILKLEKREGSQKSGGACTTWKQTAIALYLVKKREPTESPRWSLAATKFAL